MIPISFLMMITDNSEKESTWGIIGLRAKKLCYRSPDEEKRNPGRLAHLPASTIYFLFFLGSGACGHKKKARISGPFYYSADLLVNVACNPYTLRPKISKPLRSIRKTGGKGTGVA